MGNVYDRAVIEGDTYDFVSGYENQVKQLISYFPKEEKGIRAYFRMLKKVSGKSIMFFSERTMPQWLSNSLGYFLRKGFYKYSDLSTREVISMFTSDPKLTAVLCAQCGNYGLPPGKSSFAIHAMIVDHFLEGGNYPVGGASSIHSSFTEVLEAHGGTLAVKAQVKKIMIDQNKAVGVEMENGDRIYGKKIISNAGVHNTFNRLMDPVKESSDEARRVNEIGPSLSHVCLYIGLNGSDQELRLPKHNIWCYNSYRIDDDFESHFNHTPEKSPVVYISFPSAKDPAWPEHHPGTATIQVVGSFPYKAMQQWEHLAWHNRGDTYNALKEKIADYLLLKLHEVIPGLHGKIAWQELSTPLSTRHFTGYESGEIYGIEHTPKRFRLRDLRPQTRYKNLYLTGQDIVCVGVGAALFSGIITVVSVLNRNVLWTISRYRVPRND
jgi:all-trans-retinol 13,14-reductase